MPPAAQPLPAVQPDAPEQATHIECQPADNLTPPAAKVADEYRARAFELMTANVNATLEYAQRLVGVRTPGGFVELSMGHVRRQSELIVRQTTELVSIAQRLARLRRKTA